MSLPLVISPGDGGHIPHHEEVHRLLDPLSDDGVFMPSGYRQGTIASLPAAATANKGWLYYATDENRLYYSDGSAWRQQPKTDAANTWTAIQNFDDDVFFGSGRPWFDVMNAQFGAVGDGVTDDTAAWTAVFAAMALVDGATLWVEAATYRVTASLSPPRSCRIIGSTNRGLGSPALGSRILKQGFNGDLFSISYGSTTAVDIQIEHLFLQGDAPTFTGHGIASTNASDLKITDCVITGFVDNIHVEGGTDQRLRDLYISNASNANIYCNSMGLTTHGRVVCDGAGNYGLQLGTSASSCWFDGIWIEASGIANITADGTTDMHFSNIELRESPVGITFVGATVNPGQWFISDSFISAGAYSGAAGSFGINLGPAGMVSDFRVWECRVVGFEKPLFDRSFGACRFTNVLFSAGGASGVGADVSPTSLISIFSGCEFSGTSQSLLTDDRALYLNCSYSKPPFVGAEPGGIVVGAGRLPTTGLIRSPGNKLLIVVRNAADSGDLDVLRSDNTDATLISGSGQLTKVGGALTLGGGDTLYKAVTRRVALDMGSVGANSTAELALTLTGVGATGWAIHGTPEGSPNTGLLWAFRSNVADGVILRHVNATGGAIDPGVLTYDVIGFKIA